MTTSVKSKGQLTVEYLILFGMVVAAVLLIAGGRKSAFQRAYFDALREKAISMDASTHDLTGTDGSALTLPVCGNGALEAAEQCDAPHFNGQSCLTQGFVRGGTLRCINCLYDTLWCAQCGNGRRDAGEQCDGLVSGTITCVRRGFPGGGTVSCNANCTLNTSACRP